MDNLPPFEVYGSNEAALFSLKVSRGERMALLGMNWKKDTPPDNFVGFAIEYAEPGNPNFYPVSNRLSFLDENGKPIVQPSSLLSPFQKFRWVHFPFHPDLAGNYTYRVTPVFMDAHQQLSYGTPQQAVIQLTAETYPGVLNVAFTRGFVSSQSYSDHIKPGDDVNPLLPPKGTDPLDFKSKNPDSEKDLAWMGFEAREIILKLLDEAIADPEAQVRVTAYDLDEPEIVNRLVQLKHRLKIIIDSSKGHGKKTSPESKAESLLVASAGRNNVQRQKVGGLQHNKTIAVSGTAIQAAVGGSTNLSWRGLYIQNNNAVKVTGADRVKIFFDAFDKLWASKGNPSGFGNTGSAEWHSLNIPGVDAQLTFSPHSETNACLQKIADDILTTQSTLLYSLAFLYKTPGVIMEAVKKVTNTPGKFVYGIANLAVKGLDFQSPDGNPAVVFPTILPKDAAPIFKAEEAGGSGIRMHHKFVVIDFEKPTARVYMGSYNFSIAADSDNGENLWVFRDRRIAVAYMIQALSMFDHFDWRDAVAKAKAKGIKLSLKRPPAAGEKAWWKEDYEVVEKARDRVLFSS